MLDFLWPARHEPGFPAVSGQFQKTTVDAFSTLSPEVNPLKRKRNHHRDAPAKSRPEPTSAVDGATQAHDATLSRRPPSVPAQNALVSQLPSSQPARTAIGGALERRTGNALDHFLEGQAAVTAPKQSKGVPFMAPSFTMESSHPTATSVDAMSTMADTIEAQFGLEILIKHRELRLIEQELAKCQVAYEQIRRCSVIPFPSQSSTVADMLAVSTGSGSAYRNGAPAAAPWGVVDGPYSRHYRTWLIDDSVFESTCNEDARPPSRSEKRLPDRHTRGVHAEKGLFGQSGRTQRAQASTRSIPLPHDQSDRRNEKGPMIVARKSDGQMVKLMCLDCRRSDFNSVQGFINHCRIAHSRQFVSHEAAIEASGEEVDGEKAGETRSEAVQPHQINGAGLVHPMIRAARPPSPNHVSRPRNPRQPTSNIGVITRKAVKAERKLKQQASTCSDFKASLETPYLSALLFKMGRNDNLAENVIDAKRTDELDLIESLEMAESDNEADETIVPIDQSRSTRGVAQSGFRLAPANNVRPSVPQSSSAISSPDRTVQSSTYQHPTGRIHLSLPPVEPGHSGFNSFDGPMNGLASPSSNLSPGATDPNPAPSLVSDDGEYDHTQSDSDTPDHTDIESDNDHFARPHLLDHETMEIDDHDQFGLSIPDKPHPPRCRTRKIGSKNFADPEEHRHVSFAAQAALEGHGHNFMHK